MDTWQKASLLGQAAQYDTCAVCGPGSHKQRDDLGRWIYPAKLPDGRTINLLKVLQTNVCEHDCLYCVNRRSADVRRTALMPEDLARVFMDMVGRGQAMGLFLSSGVAGGADRSMSRMIDTATILRRRYGFRGYMHLKVLPGTSQPAIEQAVLLADRVSVNLEAPTARHLACIGPDKDYEQGIRTRQRWIYEVSQRGRLLPAGQTTQLVVGAAGESDQEILTTVDDLYQHAGLSRAYYSAFQPVAGTPLESHAPTPLDRERRLYQADWLRRHYGFAFGELVYDEQGNLPLTSDPKLLWAQTHPERFPIEVNTASRADLLRVPGIGPRSAGRIVQERGRGRLCAPEHLKAMGAVVDRALPYVLLDGQQPAYQLALW
ncbi:MAG: putative DNA modification/repair radical SAM protein [Chloroflexi bacterium]|nr:putative DNA modification/repair radical SAM protein [Chloroflexota bacterium]